MQPFPPPQPFWQMQGWTIALHLLLLLLVVGAIGGLLLRPKRKARSFDAAIWGMAGLMLTGMFMSMAMRTPETRIFRDGFLIFLWGVVVTGSFLSWRRLKEQKDTTGIAVSIASLAMMGFTIAFLLPTTPSAREASRRTRCKNNLHDIGVAFYEYQNDFGTLPPHDAGNPPASWRVNLLPYLKQDDLHGQYDFTTDWDSVGNIPVARQIVAEYACPSVPILYGERDGLRFTSYALAVGEGTLWPLAGPLNTEGAADGMSNTLLVLEACGQQIVWTEPRDLEVGTTPVGINLPGASEGESPGVLSSHHTGGAQATFADGSVRFLNENIDPTILEALLTADGGEEVRSF